MPLGYAAVRMTEAYTQIQLGRQDALTRLIQEKLASIAPQTLITAVGQDVVDVTLNSESHAEIPQT